MSLGKRVQGPQKWPGGDTQVSPEGEGPSKARGGWVFEKTPCGRVLLIKVSKPLLDNSQ